MFSRFLSSPVIIIWDVNNFLAAKLSLRIAPELRAVKCGYSFNFDLAYQLVIHSCFHKSHISFFDLLSLTICLGSSIFNLCKICSFMYPKASTEVYSPNPFSADLRRTLNLYLHMLTVAHIVKKLKALVVEVYNL